MRLCRVITGTTLMWVSLPFAGCSSPASSDLPVEPKPITATDTDEPYKADTGTPCLEREMVVTVGMGGFEFNPVSPGDPVIVFQGGGGGWYVDAAARIDYVAAKGAIFTTKLRLVERDLVIAGGGEWDATAQAPVMDKADADCGTGEVWGARGFINDAWPGGWPTATEVCEWEGDALEVEMVVEDLDGARTASDSVILIAEMHSLDGPFDCTPYQ